MSPSVADHQDSRCDSVLMQRSAPRGETSFHRLLLALCSAVLGMSWLLSVEHHRRVLVPGIELALPELCMARRFLGLDCPGCGMTRCFISLAHGDVAGAWSYNPAGIWLFAIMAFQVPYRMWQLWRIRQGQPEFALHWTAQLVMGFFALALMSQWLLRVAVLSR